jgi:hypothetical protein
MAALTIEALAATLERARSHALPGREVVERDGVLRELRHLLGVEILDKLLALADEVDRIR